jgi:hypothetical protein
MPRYILIFSTCWLALIPSLSLADPVVELWSRPAKAEWNLSKKGERTDLVNIYVHASEEALKNAFDRAGWTIARKKTIKTDLAYVGAAFWTFDRIRREERSQRVQSMPMERLYYNGKLPDVGYERDNRIFAGRNHFRAYDTGKQDASGLKVWAIAAVRDAGIRVSPKGIRHGLTGENAFLQHNVDPDVDGERDFVVGTLWEFCPDMVVSAEKFKLEPAQDSQDKGQHSNDSEAYEIVLK